MCWLNKKAENKPTAPVPEWAASHPAWIRLEDQLGWYDNKSIHCQNWYKRLKFIQISLAVLIPLLSQLDPEYAKWGTSIAGVMIAVLEGMQHLNQYSKLWFPYRATSQPLKH